MSGKQGPRLTLIMTLTIFIMLLFFFFNDVKFLLWLESMENVGLCTYINGKILKHGIFFM